MIQQQERTLKNKQGYKPLRHEQERRSGALQ